jgi:hypothetical protein
MSELKRVKPLRLGIALALALAIIGFVLGIFGFVGLSASSAKMEASVDSVFTFMKHSDTNIAMFGGMTLRIGKYVGDKCLKKAEQTGDEAGVKEIRKIFPKDDIEEYDIEDIRSGLDGMRDTLLPGLKKSLHCVRWWILFGLPLGLALFGFSLGILGGRIYNWLEK